MRALLAVTFSLAVAAGLVFLMARPVIVRVGAPPVSAGALYFSPGYTAPNWRAELWRYEGSADPVKVWDGPSGDNWQITCLYPYNGQLLIFMSDPDWEVNRVYRYSPATGTADLVVGDYCPEDGSTPWYNPVRQVETYGGYLYLQHGGYYRGASLYRLDPSSWALTQVATAFGGDYLIGYDSDSGAGGVAASTDGQLYWCSGRKLYSSPDGTPGSFSYLYDAAATYDKTAEIAGLHFNSADGYVYFGGKYKSGAAQAYQRVHRVRNDTVEVTRDVDVGADADTQLVNFIPLASGLMALAWGENSANNWVSIFNSGSGWADDLTQVGLASMPPSHAVFQGLPYFGLFEYAAGDTQLWRRDSAGSMTRIKQFANYYPLLSYQEDMPMATLP